MKVASGGELSRFLLALKVVLSDRGSAPTLVFDEIDTGVGGAVADAIGARLARLAGQVQVMAVTHAPQVAARANQHLLISKDALDKGKRVATRVNALAADHRREEIARMLAGAEITAEARAAAERLLQGRDSVIPTPWPKQQNQKPLPDLAKLTKAQAKVEHYPAGAGPRRARPALLPGGRTQRHRRRIRRAAPALQRDREALSGIRHGGLAIAESRRSALRALQEGPARGADAVARQRVCGSRTCSTSSAASRAS